jgi:hypothetical protein
MQTCINTGYWRECDCKVCVLIKKIKQLIFQHLDLCVITPFSILLLLTSLNVLEVTTLKVNIWYKTSLSFEVFMNSVVVLWLTKAIFIFICHSKELWTHLDHSVTPLVGLEECKCGKKSMKNYNSLWLIVFRYLFFHLYWTHLFIHCVFLCLWACTE